MSKISVIVPTYKTAKYLPKCLDSILAQSFQDFEIIIISDGPEEDNKIADEYAQKDSRIKVIKDIKNGLGGARNAGMDVAIGDYISFIDSDDWIEPHTLEKSLQAIKNNDADLVIFDVNVTGDALLDKREGEINYLKLKFDGLQDITREQIFNTNVSAWNKLYKKDIIDSYNLRFPEKMEYEDFPFFFFYMMVSKKAYYLNEKLYNYFRREDCGMAKTYDGDFNSIQDHVAGCVFLYKNLVEKKLFKKNKEIFDEILNLYIRIAIDNLKTKETKDKMSKYVYKLLKKEKIKIPKNKNVLKNAIQNIFSIKNEFNHKVLRILGVKLKIKRKPPNNIADKPEFYNVTVNQGNKIYVINDGVKSELQNKIEGLDIEISGSNNVIEIFMPSYFEQARIRIASNNSFIRIEQTPKFMYTINCWGGGNQRFYWGKGSDTSWKGVVHLADDNASVIIGEDCMFAGETTIWAADAHAIFDIGDKKRVINKINTPLKIGSHCWIGQGVTITKNAKISNNTIIGTSSVVTKKFDEENIAIAGNPAKIVKRNCNWSRKSTYYYELEQKKENDYA